MTDYEIESPVMPPKKEFRIELIVKSIERGKPSDFVEAYGKSKDKNG